MCDTYTIVYDVMSEDAKICKIKVISIKRTPRTAKYRKNHTNTVQFTALVVIYLVVVDVRYGKLSF